MCIRDRECRCASQTARFFQIRDGPYISMSEIRLVRGLAVWLNVFLSGLLSSGIRTVLAVRQRTEMIVEAKDVKFFVLKEEAAADGTRLLKVEGLVFHSSLAVDKI